MQPQIARRALLCALASALLLPPRRSNALAKRLDPNDPQAQALGYVEDATRVPLDKFATYRQGQTCANCSLVQVHYGPLRPCKLFPGKFVKEKGWCSAWAARTFDKT